MGAYTWRLFIPFLRKVIFLMIYVTYEKYNCIVNYFIDCYHGRTNVLKSYYSSLTLLLLSLHLLITRIHVSRATGRARLNFLASSRLISKRPVIKYNISRGTRCVY